MSRCNFARHANGTLLCRAEREQFTWFGDMILAPHLLNIFGLGGCEVEVVFHKPLKAADFTRRKALAQRCWDIVLAQVVGTDEAFIETLAIGAE